MVGGIFFSVVTFLILLIYGSHFGSMSGALREEQKNKIEEVFRRLLICHSTSLCWLFPVLWQGLCKSKGMWLYIGWSKYEGAYNPSKNAGKIACLLEKAITNYR